MSDDRIADYLDELDAMAALDDLRCDRRPPGNTKSPGGANAGRVNQKEKRND